MIVGNTMAHSRQEHEIRCSEPGITRLLIAYNDLSRPNNNKGGIELRKAHWFYVAHNHIDGGTMRVGPQDDPNIKAQFPNWASIKCDWGVIEDNRFDRIWVHVRLGSEHIMVRNNSVHVDDAEWAYIVACEKPGFDDVRKVVDLTIENNTAINTGTRGRFLFVQGRPVGLVVRNNLFVAPRLREGGAAAGRSSRPTRSMAGFAEIQGNVYPAGPGGTHVAGKSDVSRQEWASKPMVKGERYQDVRLDPDDNPPANLVRGRGWGRTSASTKPSARPRARARPTTARRGRWRRRRTGGRSRAEGRRRLRLRGSSRFDLGISRSAPLGVRSRKRRTRLPWHIATEDEHFAHQGVGTAESAEKG